MLIMEKEFRLVEIAGRLALQALHRPNLNSLFIDLDSEEKKYRLKTSSRSDPLIKALGKSGKNVFDATFGLGNDALTMLRHGYAVEASERSPMLVALWEDAIKHLSVNAKLRKIILENLKLFQQDAKTYLKNIKSIPDIIYLDPMYPKKKKSSLQRKEMLLLRELVGEDKDSHELFQLAKTRAKDRVVVKRPLPAPAVAEDVSYTVKANTVRFDVYLIEKKTSQK